MKSATRLQLNALAAQAGASWRLVREGRHLVIDFTAGGRTVRRVMSATPSDRRALANMAADLRRALRRWVGSQIWRSYLCPLGQVFNMKTRNLYTVYTLRN